MVELERLLAATIREHGRRPALRIAGQMISYRAFDRWSRRIAACLHGSTVAILAGGSLGTYAGVLAVARSGRMYVPLNVDLPDDRLLQIIAAAGTDTLIVDRRKIDQACRLLKRMPRPICVVVPEIEDDACADLQPHHVVLVGEGPAPPPDEVDVAAADDAPLYLMSTSGTTGEPKRISIYRRNVQAYLGSIRQLFDFHPEDRFSQFFKLPFDLSVHDMFVTWTTGGCLYVPGPTDLLDPVAFARRNGLTVWFSVPSLVSLAIMSRKLKPGSLPTVRHGLFCGEALSWEVVDAFRQAAPEAAVTNLYGPTEATIAITHYTVPANDGTPEQRRTCVPIGRPFDGQDAVVVDPELRTLPPGGRGELLLGGSQLASGYVGSPEQTERSFLHLEFAGHASKRWYRTGDLAAWTPNGLVFAGRLDSQVKFRGHRIELGEIEAILQQVANTPLAVVIGWPPNGSGPVEQLVAFVVTSRPGFQDVLAELRRRLPAYMVPGRIVAIDEPPASLLNNNQKIDRNKIVDMYRMRLS